MPQICGLRNERGGRFSANLCLHWSPLPLVEGSAIRWNCFSPSRFCISRSAWESWLLQANPRQWQAESLRWECQRMRSWSL